LLIKAHDKTAMIWKDRAISYQELFGFITGFAELHAAYKSGKVAIFSENRPEWAYSFFSAWQNESVAVPIDFMASADEVAYILNDCQPEVIFYSSQTEAVMRKAMESINFSGQSYNLDELDVPSAETELKSITTSDLLRTAVIIYTSGTTGSPKGVMLSFDNLLANTEAVTEGVQIFTPDRNVMVLLPLHHIFPLLGTLVAPLSAGATIAFAPGLTSEAILSTLQKHQIAIIIGVPRLYSMIQKGIKDKINSHFITRALFGLAQVMHSQKFSRTLFKTVHQRFGGHIDYLVCGGAKLDETVARDFRTLGFEMLEGFGMTEAAPMITFTRPGRVKIGSAGEPVTTLEVTSMDGEIVARGRNVMKGYYNRPEETAEVIKDGWLHTGDLGYLDRKGFIHITGRKKEIIVLSNGKNINPEEIEQKILSSTGLLTDIGVFAKDDTLCAAILPDFKAIREKGFVNIQESLRGEVFDHYNQNVSPYKKIQKFIIVKEDLPRTRLGKLQRHKLPGLAESGAASKKDRREPQFQEYIVIREYLEKQTEGHISPDDHFEIDLSMDSLDKISFQTFVQSTFGIEMKEDIFLHHPTVEKLSNYIRDTKVKISIEAVKWAEILREKVDLKLPKSWFTQNLFKNFFKVALKSYFRVKSEGVENIPNGPFIIAANHQSFLDGAFVAIFLKRRLMKNTYFYAKEKHVRRPLLKFMAQRHNIIIMDINRDLKQSLQKMAEVLRKGRNLIIFPEGTRSKDGQLGNFKKTFAILSRELNVPVVPVSIKGAYEALPRGSKFPRPFKSIRIKFHKPVFPEQHTYDSLSELVFNHISGEVA